MNAGKEVSRGRDRDGAGEGERNEWGRRVRTGGQEGTKEVKGRKRVNC